MEGFSHFPHHKNQYSAVDYLACVGGGGGGHSYETQGFGWYRTTTGANLLCLNPDTPDFRINRSANIISACPGNPCILVQTFFYILPQGSDFII
jgi:hypothetical protein